MNLSTTVNHERYSKLLPNLPSLIFFYYSDWADEINVKLDDSFSKEKYISFMVGVFSDVVPGGQFLPIIFNRWQEKILLRFCYAD